jgi:hypothetical protein
MPVIIRLYPNIDRIICEISGCMYIQFQVEYIDFRVTIFCFLLGISWCWYVFCNFHISTCFAMCDTWCCIVIIITVVAVSISPDTQAPVVHSD